MKDLSHINPKGGVRMVNIGDKPETVRQAVAEGYVVVGEKLAAVVRGRRTPKGDLFDIARIAGIMAAKKTPELIPLCHQIALNHVKLDFELKEDRILITASVETRSATGVEMEALTAVTVAALTIYDMLKALSHEISFEGIRLLEKSGGKSGHWKNPVVDSKTGEQE